MALTELLIGRPPEYDHEADPLAKPFPGEADSIEAHVEICARRYGKIMQGQAKSDLATYDLKAFFIKALVAGFIALAVLDKGVDALALIAKVL